MKLLSNNRHFKSFLRDQDMWKVVGIGSQWVSIDKMRKTISQTNYICEFILSNCDTKGHKIQPDALPSVRQWQLNNYLSHLEGMQVYYLYEALMDVDSVIEDLMLLNEEDRIEFLCQLTGKSTWYLLLIDQEINSN